MDVQVQDQIQEGVIPSHVTQVYHVHFTSSFNKNLKYISFLVLMPVLPELNKLQPVVGITGVNAV